MKIQIKRVYEDRARTDGFRALVDRLWPRGMTREAAELDMWAKGVAPSSELRKEFAHMPERFADFRKAYTKELRANADAMEELLEAARKSRKKTLTLLYAAKDPACNHAIVLAGELKRRIDA
ncbi:MAG: hypothetical protein DHS20C14_12460 [Phycisphaeraceae bacterium]|nr:MAG: hypothetical protein DHS20C14_12460 [Phycisphaeraceae bacterium]